MQTVPIFEVVVRMCVTLHLYVLPKTANNDYICIDIIIMMIIIIIIIICMQYNLKE
jgi:hypothetical protein